MDSLGASESFTQLSSDPGKKGTLFWEDHFSEQPPKKNGNREPLNN